MMFGLGGRSSTRALIGPMAAWIFLPSMVFAQTESCSTVTTASLNIAGAVILASKLQEADKDLPRHCVLSGTINERTGVDGKSYAIQFEARLPADWNGRFLHQVNGGNDGEVVPALGDKPDFKAMGGRSALARGYAVISSDSGHSGHDAANKAMGLAGGAAFGFDPQARRDYGYSADLTLAPIARAIIAAHYGRKPDYSYMYGCSNGGRHAMVDASRMPEAYDGFLVGNPGFDLPKAAIQHAWDFQNFTKIDPDIRKAFTKDDANLVSAKIIDVCDALDGVRDGLTSNMAACQKAFDFSSLQCVPGATEGCLSEVKVAALKAIFAGPSNSRGEALYSDWPVDGGIGKGNWRLWKVESPIVPWNHYPIITTMGAASLATIFTTPPTKVEGDNDHLNGFLAKFDFDRDAPKIFARDPTFSESAMEFMTPPDVDDPKLSGLKAANHKMIIFHGQADPVFSVNDTIRWYQRLDANSGGNAKAFARLFTIPGVTHCGGGMGLDRFDALQALADWVEKGKAPEQIIASMSPGNKDIPASWSTTRSRPLCPWPGYAKYQGGEIETAASFACASP
ncbi:MAG: tannase/feruloyl esterase family alpha/beta hydrolase [Bradyrhizobium sp.]